MRRVVASLVFALNALTAAAGDYMLTVADAPAARATPTANASWPVETSGAVVADLERYFAGADPAIGILEAAFVNGHVRFQGPAEKRAVERGLVSVAAGTSVRRERALFDIMAIHASRAMLEDLRAEHARDDLAPAALERLARLTERVERAVESRRLRR